MKKSNNFHSWLLVVLLVILVIQSIMLFNAYNKSHEVEISNNTKISQLAERIDTIWSDFYLQNIDIPKQIYFADKELTLDDVVREEIFAKVVRFKSERWRWPIINYRLDKYYFVLDSLRSMNASEDLIYLAIQESFLNPRAVSWAKAAGFWQFMPPTGRAYKLKINEYIDQRFDPGEATIAAVKHFNDLLKVFSGNCALSAAAYNVGENRVLQSMRIKGTDNYFDLSLPRETAEYFINILAWKIVMEADDNFIKRFSQSVDFSIPSIEVRLTLSQILMAKELLPVFSYSYRVWRVLNPMYVRDLIPKGTHLIKIPKESLAIFNQIIERKKASYVVIENN